MNGIEKNKKIIALKSRFLTERFSLSKKIKYHISKEGNIMTALTGWIFTKIPDMPLTIRKLYFIFFFVSKRSITGTNDKKTVLGIKVHTPAIPHNSLPGAHKIPLHNIVNTNAKIDGLTIVLNNWNQVIE